MARTLSRTSVVTLALVLASFVAQAQGPGNADFSRYVALGDSLTAGTGNLSLVATRQVVSFPAILQSHVGVGGPFEQPLILEPGLPTQLELANLSPVLIQQQMRCVAEPARHCSALNPCPTGGCAVQLVQLPDFGSAPDPGSFVNFFLPRPYDNLGIPGQDVSDALNTVCQPLAVNPNFCAILRNVECAGVFDVDDGQCGAGPGGLTALEQSLFSDETTIQASFMTVWLGPNDALQAATSGIVNDITLTPLAEFTTDYQQVITTLSAAGVQLALANVPDVTSIPFTTTVPWFLVDATGQPVLGPMGQLIPLLGTTGAGVERPLGPSDLVLLPAREQLQQGVGIPGTGMGALGSTFVLDMDEIATIRQRIAGFNTVILNQASSAGAAHVDVFTLLNQVTANGVIIGGIEYSTDFLTGGLFSIDGVHPAPLGYAIITQWFVDAINLTYGGTLPPVDLAPFVFGFGGGGGGFPGIGTEAAVFTEAARDEMLRAMGAPDSATLEQNHRIYQPLVPRRNVGGRQERGRTPR